MLINISDHSHITCVLSACGTVAIQKYAFHYPRWVKFEEDVEEGGERWSKPYVATLSLHSLYEVRETILKCTIMLDVEAQNFFQLTGEREIIHWECLTYLMLVTMDISIKQM